MPILNYDSRFAGAVRTGHKRQTIRPRRTPPIKPGDTLYHFANMGSRNRQSLLATACTQVWPLTLSGQGLRINGVCLDPCDAETVARDDGFNNFAQLEQYISDTYGLPFEGDLIKWSYQPATQEARPCNSMI